MHLFACSDTPLQVMKIVKSEGVQILTEAYAQMDALFTTLSPCAGGHGSHFFTLRLQGPAAKEFDHLRVVYHSCCVYVSIALLLTCELIWRCFAGRVHPCWTKQQLAPFLRSAATVHSKSLGLGITLDNRAPSNRCTCFATSNDTQTKYLHHMPTITTIIRKPQTRKSFGIH